MPIFCTNPKQNETLHVQPSWSQNARNPIFENLNFPGENALIPTNSGPPLPRRITCQNPLSKILPQFILVVLFQKQGVSVIDCLIALEVTEYLSSHCSTVMFLLQRISPFQRLPTENLA